MEGISGGQRGITTSYRLCDGLVDIDIDAIGTIGLAFPGDETRPNIMDRPAVVLKNQG